MKEEGGKANAKTRLAQVKKKKGMGEEGKAGLKGKGAGGKSTKKRKERTEKAGGVKAGREAEAKKPKNAEKTCPMPGCGGQGHRSGRFQTHVSRSGCPLLPGDGEGRGSSGPGAGKARTKKGGGGKRRG